MVIMNTIAVKSYSVTDDSIKETVSTLYEPLNR